MSCYDTQKQEHPVEKPFAAPMSHRSTTDPPDPSACCVIVVASHEESRETRELSNLSTETVQSAALSLESVDDIEGGDGLSLGVLGVGDGVSDDTFKEGLQDTASLLVDHCLDESATICDAWQVG